MAPKTQIKARLILASKNTSTGVVLYTWELTFPRFLLAELNTHRAASRNTASSRAIPSRKFRSTIWGDPFVPLSFPQNQRGMQGGEEISGWRRSAAESVWKAARFPNLLANWTLEKLSVHKQVGNRLLEAHMWCVQVLSATDVNNMLLLRTDSAAEPHFQELAKQMHRDVDWVREMCQWEAKTADRATRVDLSGRHGNVQFLDKGKWHLPYVTAEEKTLDLEIQKEISIARCANTSYTTVGEGRVIDAEQSHNICEKLFGGKIKHLSPTEHTACAMEADCYFGNFRSFCQYRQTIPNEAGGDRE